MPRSGVRELEALVHRRADEGAIRDDRTDMHGRTLPLACLETRVALADHEHLAAPAHDLAVAVPLLRGLQGRKHLHGGLLTNESGLAKPESVACINTCRKPADTPPAGRYSRGFRFPPTGVSPWLPTSTRPASTPFVSCRWTWFRRPTAVIPACRWAPRRWRTCCGRGSSSTTLPIRTGWTAIASCCRPATAPRCNTACCTSPGTASRSTTSSSSANGAARRPAIPSAGTPQAWKSPPARWDRGWPTPSAWPWPRPSLRPATTAKAIG